MHRICTPAVSSIIRTFDEIRRHFANSLSDKEDVSKEFDKRTTPECHIHVETGDIIQSRQLIVPHLILLVTRQKSMFRTKEELKVHL